MEHTDLVTLTRFMADSGYSADEVAYAVEKPWKHTDTLAEARAAEYAERNAMDDVVSGNVWPETDFELANRALAAAIDAGVKLGIHGPVTLGRWS